MKFNIRIFNTKNEQHKHPSFGMITNKGHHGLVVKASDFQAEGHGFESCSRQTTQYYPRQTTQYYP